MMTEPYEIRPKKFKRKKKHDAQDWDQSDVVEELEAARRKGRIHCRSCRKFVPWQKLDPSWEWAGKVLQCVWYCSLCRNAVLVKDYPRIKRKKTRRKKKRSP